ncbi:MAG: cobalt-precorrin-6A reductase [Alphaproteobacteria bacterium]
MRLLILGGTIEARALADQAQQRYGPGLDVITSLAGRTAQPIGQAGAVRSGGFGGASGLADYLRHQSIDVVIDATHPFAATMSAHACEACAEVQVPRLMVVRAPWQMRDGDNWIEVDDIAAAAAALPALKTVSAGRARVMLTLGASALTYFGGLKGFWFLARMIEAPADPLPLRHCRVIEGRGPFTVAGERELLVRHRIDVLVSRQSGGAATGAKIDAARTLGLPVVMIKRPPLAPGPHAATVEDALIWLDETLSLVPS